MPTYTIASPTGEEYEIEAPQGASQQQAFEFFKREHSAGRVKPKNKAKAGMASDDDKYASYLSNFSKQNSGMFVPPGAQAPVPQTKEEFLKWGNQPGAPKAVAGGLEMGLNLLGGVTGPVLAPIGAGIKKLTKEKPGTFEQEYGEAFGDVSSMGTRLADTLGVRTKVGDALNTELADFVNRNLQPFTGIHMPARLPSRLEMKARFGSDVVPETPVNSVLANLEQQSVPKQTPSTAPDAMLSSRNESLFEQGRQEFADFTRQEEAQAILDARQREMEQQVARQTSLDMNAAERARQEQAPTGYSQWLAEQAIREAQQTHDFLSRAKQDEIDATPYGDVPAQYGSTLEHGRIDENGMPIRADLSMEAQNLQNPLQRNLWGDELGPGQGASKSLTSALDSMPPGPMRDVALGQLTGLNKAQRGMLDFESVGHSFRNINKKLSQLTDQPWVRAAFPAHRFETNKDGSPRIMLHGTKDAFNDRPRTTVYGYEGLHAGYGGAATIKASKTTKDGKIGYREGNLRYQPKATGNPEIDLQANNPAVYPIAVRKGNYPRMRGDYNSWEPMKLADSREFKSDLAKITGRGYYAIDDLMQSYKENILGKSLSPKEENMVFARMLKDQLDIDGFYYPNKFESATHQLGTKGKTARQKMMAEKIGLEDSLVVYDDNNMVSLYDAAQQAPSMNSGMSRGQRGALKFDDVGDIVQKFVKGVAKSVEQQRLPVSAREKLLQTVQRDNSFVLRPMETEDIVAKALQEPDSKMNKYTQSGAISAGDKVGSTLVRETGRWMNWARSTGEKYFRERVKPVEHVLSAVPKADLETAMQVMIKEMFNKERFSDQRLMEAGMTKDAMFARQKLIEAYDAGITTLNQTREKLGMRPVKPMEAYFSSQFNGDYLISVVDSSGRPVGLATAATRAEANKALAWIKKNMPEHENVSIVDRRTSAANNRTPRDVSSLYEGLMDVFKNTPMEAELRQMMEGRAEMQAYTERGFYNHFKNKTGIRFFIGDRPWLDQRQNAIQAAQAQVKYLKDLYNWIPTQEAMAQLKGVFTDEQLMRSQPNNLAYAKASMDNFMGISKSATKTMEDFLAGGIAKVSTGELSKYVGSLKSLTYLKQLGASVGYAIATPLQMLLYAPSFHNMLSGSGIKHNPVVTMAKTLKDVQAILVTHSLDKIGTSIHDKALSPFANDALRYMEDNGIITKSLYDEYAQLGTHKAVDLANQTLGSTITAPDKLARLLGFMSFAHHLKDGKAPMSDLEIFRRAAELTDKAAVPLERHNRPLVADKLGLAGELAFMYKAPVFMAFNNLLELGSHAHKTGNTKPLLMALGATLMLGGAMSLPGMSEMDSGFELLKDLNANFGSKDLAVYLKDKGVKQTMLQHLPDAVTYGALSASTNTQLSTRFGNEAINLQDPFNGMVPGAQTVKEIASSTWGLLMKPDYTQLQQSIHSMGLPLTRGLQESYGDEFTAGDMGGKRSVLRPSDIRGQETVYARNEADQSRRKMGLMSLDEAKARDIDYRSRQDEKRMQEVRNRAAKEFFFNAMKKQDTSDDVITFLQAGGEPDELLREFDTRIQKRALTPEVRELLKATKLREIQAIVQKMKMGRQYAN